MYTCEYPQVNWFEAAAEKQFVYNYCKSLGSVKVYSGIQSHLFFAGRHSCKARNPIQFNLDQIHLVKWFLWCSVGQIH